VKKLRPVSYYYDLHAQYKIINAENPANKPDSDKTGQQLQKSIAYTGFMAQEVEAAAKEVGYNFSGLDKPKNAQDLCSLRYTDFTVPLVKAVQEKPSSNN
jgi:trimeric autotransporter adhesin